MTLPERTPRTRHRARAVLLVLLVLAAAAFGYAAWFQANYGALPGQLPVHIQWCGRDYAKSGDPQAALLPGAPLGGRVTSVPHLWTEWPAYATVDPLSRNTDRPCTQVLYLKTATSRYVHYVLQGGP